ncbi:unnamed protein product [Natator depressus]
MHAPRRDRRTESLYCIQPSLRPPAPLCPGGHKIRASFVMKEVPGPEVPGLRTARPGGARTLNCQARTCWGYELPGLEVPGLSPGTKHGARESNNQPPEC